MFLAKLKATVATVAVLALLGVGGFVYSGGGQTKRPSELEALRKENQLLKVNLRVTLEKIQTLEKELALFKGQKKPGRDLFDAIKAGRPEKEDQTRNELDAGKLKKPRDLRIEDEKRLRQLHELESVRKDLIKANTPGSRQRAIDILDRMIKLLQEPERKGLLEPMGLPIKPVAP